MVSLSFKCLPPSHSTSKQDAVSCLLWVSGTQQRTDTKPRQCVHTEVSVHTGVYTGMNKNMLLRVHTRVLHLTLPGVPGEQEKASQSRQSWGDMGCPTGQRVGECAELRSLGTGSQGKPSHIQTEEGFRAQGSHRCELGGRGGPRPSWPSAFQRVTLLPFAKSSYVAGKPAFEIF